MEIIEALELFVQRERGNGRSESWIGTVTRSVRALSLWTPPPRTIEQLNPEMLARYLGSSEARCRPDGKPRLVTTINAARTSLRSFGQFLVDADLVTSNPARLVRRAKSGDPAPRALSEPELRRFLDTIAAAQGRAARRDRVLFETLAGTGMRLSSALALRASDLDFAAGEVIVRTVKADARYRAVLPRSLEPLLIEYVSEIGGGALFSIGRRQAHARWTHWLRAAGIETRVGVHSLRHGVGHRVYAATHDVTLVREALGHKALASSLRYMQPDRSRLRAVMER